MSALLRGLAKGFRKPKIGKTDIVRDTQEAIEEAAEEVAKQKGAGPKIRKEEIDIFKDEVNEEGKKRADKLKLALAASGIEAQKAKVAVDKLAAETKNKLLGINLSSTRDSLFKNAYELIDGGVYADDKAAGMSYIASIPTLSTSQRTILERLLPGDRDWETS